MNRRQPGGAAAQIVRAEPTPALKSSGRLAERLNQLGVRLLAYAFERPLEAVFISVDGRRLIGMSPRLSRQRRQEVLSGILLKLESDSSLAFMVLSEPEDS